MSRYRFNSPRSRARTIEKLWICIFSVWATLWASNSAAVDVLDIGLIEKRPWAYRTELGKQEGIYLELFREVENSLDGTIKLKIHLLPLARILHEMGSAAFIDLAIMSHRPERTKLMYPLVPLYKTPFVLLSLESSGIQNLEDLQGRRVAMLIGGSKCPCLDGAVTYQKIELNDHSLGIKMLFRKRVDAVAGPAMRIYRNIEELSINEKLSPPIFYEWRTVWVWSSKDTSQVNKFTLFKEHLISVLAAGKLKELASKYLYPVQAEFFYDLSQNPQLVPVHKPE